MDLESDPGAYDCDTCQVRTALDALSEENAEAWTLFHRLASRFLVDTHLVAEAFRLLTIDWASSDVLDLIERLNVLYDILLPPPTPSS